MANMTPTQLAAALITRCVGGPGNFTCWETVDQVADWLREQEGVEPERECPYTGFAHTKHWCGYDGCREG